MVLNLIGEKPIDLWKTTRYVLLYNVSLPPSETLGWQLAHTLGGRCMLIDLSMCFVFVGEIQDKLLVRAGLANTQNI